MIVDLARGRRGPGRGAGRGRAGVDPDRPRPALAGQPGDGPGVRGGGPRGRGRSRRRSPWSAGRSGSAWPTTSWSGSRGRATSSRRAAATSRRRSPGASTRRRPSRPRSGSPGRPGWASWRPAAWAGVHRGASTTFDISTDLDELARADGMAVVCSGVKSILDVPATLDALETRGVAVVGYRTDTFPAFTTASSGLPLDARVDTPDEAAALVRAHRGLGPPRGRRPGPAGRPSRRRSTATRWRPRWPRASSWPGPGGSPARRSRRSCSTTSAGPPGAGACAANRSLIVANARLAGRGGRGLAGGDPGADRDPPPARSPLGSIRSDRRPAGSSWIDLEDLLDLVGGRGRRRPARWWRWRGCWRTGRTGRGSRRSGSGSSRAPRPALGSATLTAASIRWTFILGQSASGSHSSVPWMTSSFSGPTSRPASA